MLSRGRVVKHLVRAKLDQPADRNFFLVSFLKPGALVFLFNLFQLDNGSLFLVFIFINPLKMVDMMSIWYLFWGDSF